MSDDDKLPPFIDTDTSLAAAVAIAEAAPHLREQVLRAVIASPRCCFELESALKLSHETCSARIWELLKSEMVEHREGDYRLTEHGRRAKVYRATPRGARRIANRLAV